MSAQFQDNNLRRSVVVQAECDSIREFVPSALISNAVSPVDNSVAIIGGKKSCVGRDWYLFEVLGSISIGNENPVIKRKIDSCRDEVRPRIETAASFHTFPSAVFPF